MSQGQVSTQGAAGMAGLSGAIKAKRPASRRRTPFTTPPPLLQAKRKTSREAAAIVTTIKGGLSVGKLLWKAIRAGLWGLLLGPLFGALVVIGLMIFDPKCARPGDSGGCAMGLVTVPLGIAIPSFCLLFALGLLHGLWQRRPADWGAAIRRLRNWGRDE